MVEAEVLSEQYAGDGVTDDFEYGFTIFEAAELVASLINDSTGARTLWVVGVDFTIEGVGEEGGGEIHATTAPAVGFTLDLRPVYSTKQPTGFKNAGKFLPENHELAFDRRAYVDQMLLRLVRRCLHIADYGEPTVDLEVPFDRAGMYLAFDALKKPIPSAGTGNDSALRTDLASTTSGSDGSLLSGYRVPETGSVARSVGSRLRSRYWLQDFGALPDDSTDYTTQIAAAIAIVAARGKRLVIEGGFFRAGQLALVSGTWMQFEGGGIRLRNGGNNFLLANPNGAQYVDDVALENPLLRGNKANNTSGGGIYLNGRNNYIIGGDVQDFPYAGLLIGVASNGGINTPLAGKHRIIGGLYKNNGANNGWGQLAFTHGTDVKFIGTQMDGSDGQGTYGGDIEPESGNIAETIEFHGCSIIAGRLFFDCANLGGSNVGRYLKWIGGFIDARGSFAVVGPNDPNLAPISLRQTKDVDIAHCDLIGRDDAQFGGVYSEDVGATTTFTNENLRLTAVKVQSAAPAVRAGYFSECLNVTLTNCHWEINSSSNAMEFPNGTTRFRASNSTIRNAGAGGSVNIGSTAVDVKFDESCNFLGGSGGLGVTVNATAAGNGCEVRRVLTGSQTWDPASIADGDEAELAVTIAGLALGDFIDAVSFSVDVSDLGVSYAVTATDTASISLLNNTGGAVDLPTGTVRVRGLKVA